MYWICVGDGTAIHLANSDFLLRLVPSSPEFPSLAKADVTSIESDSRFELWARSGRSQAEANNQSHCSLSRRNLRNHGEWVAKMSHD